MTRIFLRHCIKWIVELLMSKKNITVSVLLASLLLFRFFVRNPEIIHVEQSVAMMDLVIKEPPLTRKGKITWWESNETIIKKEYGSPKGDENGVYFINLLDGGNGLQKLAEDSSNWFSFTQSKFYCFDEIKSEERCFENNIIMTIFHDESNKVHYLINNEEVLN